MKVLKQARIESLRQDKGWTQGQLAAYAKVERSYITKIELGQAPNVSGVILARIAAALGTTTDYLLGLVDDPSQPVNPSSLSNAERALRTPLLREIVEVWDILPPEFRRIAHEVVVHGLARKAAEMNSR